MSDVFLNTCFAVISDQIEIKLDYMWSLTQTVFVCLRLIKNLRWATRQTWAPINMPGPNKHCISLNKYEYLSCLYWTRWVINHSTGWKRWAKQLVKSVSAAATTRDIFLCKRSDVHSCEEESWKSSPAELFQFSVLRMSWLNTSASQLASGSGWWHVCFKQMNFLHHPVDFPMPFIQLGFLSLESFMLLHMSACVIWDFWTNLPVRCGFFLVSFKITCCALGMISAGYSRLKKEEAALNFFHL